MKIYLSYCEADEALARKLTTTLQSAGLEVWDEECEIFLGDNWAELVAQALRECEAMVVLFSAHAIGSKRIARDSSYAMSEPRYCNRLLTVRVGTREQVPDESIPWILRRMQFIALPQNDDTAGLEKLVEILLENRDRKLYAAHVMTARPQIKTMVSPS